MSFMRRQFTIGDTLNATRY